MTHSDAAQLVRLLLEHRDSLFGFTLALTHDREAAEEIFQEVGLAVAGEAQKKTAVERFLPWVHEMIRRRVAEYFRKSSRRREVEHAEPLHEAVALAFEEAGAGASELGRRQSHLEDCLEELSPAQRGMVEGRYRDHRSLREMAREADSTEGSLKVLLFRVRRLLARCIEEKMGPGGGRP
ncbi:MAG TPA: sigma-70 family RNA polymerase sigma factor [Planctomycetota bacterium]|nr:sigma-70 family RNA polymerase sigma factor [Planctomycetota bacterium]